jgi:hypothetical protein
MTESMPALSPVLLNRGLCLGGLRRPETVHYSHLLGPVLTSFLVSKRHQPILICTGTWAEEGDETFLTCYLGLLREDVLRKGGARRR